MSRRIFVSAGLLGAGLALATVYNACGKFDAGTSGAQTSNSSGSNCANQTTLNAELSNGALVPKKIAAPSANVFAHGKAILGQLNPAPGKTGALKTLGAALNPNFAAGQELAVVVDGGCLRANAGAIGNSNAIISRAALPHLIDELDQQAFTWTLESAMSANEISAQAESEACVVGVSFSQTFTASAFTANDPLRAQQSYAALDQADAAYQMAFASGTGLALTGPAVVVATVDLGADVNHPDLVGHFWNGAGGHGFNLAKGGSDVTDISSIGHGTHVAGMIAAVSNNGAGITGVMPYRVLVMPIQIYSVGSDGQARSSTSLVYNAIRVAVANGASVINLSLQTVTQAGPQSDPVMQQVLNEAVAAGVTVVVVIGNAGSSGQGSLIDNVAYSAVPAIYSTIAGVIGVGAIDVNGGGKSTFSNYSTTYAEIGAPGSNSGGNAMLSTIPVALGGYGFLEGTSQAAPQVSAAAALTYAIIRDAYGVSPSAGEVERLIENSATKQTGLARYFKNGNQLNLQALVSYIRSEYPLTLTGRKVPGC